MQNCLIWHHTALVFSQALSSTEPLLVFEGGHEVHIGGRCFILMFQNTKDFHREICEFVFGLQETKVFQPLDVLSFVLEHTFAKFAVCLFDGLSSISLVDLWWPGKVHNQKKLTNTRWSHPTSAQRNRSWNMIHISKRIKTYKVNSCYIHKLWFYSKYLLMFSCTFVHTLYPQVLFIHSICLLYMYSNMQELVP